MDDECPRCGNYAAAGSSFCGACGRDLRSSNGPKDDVPGTSPQGTLSVILQIACVALVIVAAFELIAVLIKSGDVLSFLSDKILTLFLIIPFPTGVFSISGPALQAYWVFVVAAIVVCAAFATAKFLAGTKIKGGPARPNASENTAVFWVCALFSTMLLINFIVVYITEVSGGTTTVPDFGDTTEQIFGMANAAVWEEIITRLLYIGVPMAVISLIATRKIESLKCLLGGFGMSKTAILFIMISGIVFGMAHYGGWDDQAWKVLTAGLMGMFLGYVFVHFGLYAAILMHFINNSLSAFDWMGAGGIGVIVILMFMIVGALALFYVICRVYGSKDSVKDLPLFRNSYIKEQ